MIRESKQNQNDKIANKLKSDPLSSRNWRTILKSFIYTVSKSAISLLVLNGIIYFEEKEKKPTSSILPYVNRLR